MIPKVLFRYYPASQQTLENIKRQCFYFGGVDAFNDPFECQLAQIVANDDPVTIEAMQNHYSNSADIPKDVRDKIRDTATTEFTEMLKRSALEMVALTKKDFILNRGVICFSEKKESLLMWSHYATGGTGLCLEFDTNDELFQSSIKVKYSDTPPVLDAISMLKSTYLARYPSWIGEMYCTKPFDWRYEQEWRIIHQKRGTIYHYPAHTLKAVYFGPRCSDAFLEIVCLILQGQNRAVQFWRGSMSKTKYEVEFTKVTYTPINEAGQKL